jgi:glutamate-1-semialdehyde 2,1-aminomutase
MHPVPLFFEAGEGSYLIDVDGNRYVDYALGMGPDIPGHAPAAVAAAVGGSLAKGQLFAGQQPAEVELARRVQRAVPSAERVRLGLTGSEMVQAALRVARASTGRSRVVKFEGHYHGWFDTILVSTQPPLDEAGPREAPDSWLPSAGQSRAAAADVAVLPWNDAALLEAFLEREGDEIAAVIMEPILCNTCVVLPVAGYLEAVRELCDRHGIVLVFDEVITGFRVALGGAQSLLGVTPDLTVLAKAIAGGYPLAALAGKAQLMDLLGGGTVRHGGTYNANGVAVAAGNAVLAELAAGGGAVYPALRATGESLMAGLQELEDHQRRGLHVQGVGPVFNTTFGATGPIVDYRSYAQTDLARQRRFLVALQEEGVRVTSRGTWFLSTAHTSEDVAETLAAARRALRAST